MKWKDGFWSAYNLVADTGITAMAGTFNIVGSLGCLIGGGLFSLSFAINETITGAYYGSASTTGEALINFAAPSLNYQMNTTIPFQKSYEDDGAISHNINEYWSAESIALIGAIFTGGGMALRGLGANILLWQQSCEDIRYFKNERKKQLKFPAWNEYMYISLESLFGSLAYASLGTSLFSGGIYFSGLVGSKQRYTYPSKGDSQVNSTSYTGPVNSLFFPLNLEIAKNVTIEVLGRSIDVQITEQVQAVADLLYGGGVFLQSNTNPDDIPLPLSLGIGGSAALANRFFNSKARHARDNRVLAAKPSQQQDEESRHDGYSPI